MMVGVLIMKMIYYNKCSKNDEWRIMIVSVLC